MEELLKAMGCKSVNDMSLEEIRTRITDYEDFMNSLEEISEIMENNTGLGLLLSELGEPEYHLFNEIKYGLERREDYKPLAEVLLLIWQRINAKLGEISFMIDNDLDELNFREAEILDDMEQSQIADSEYCEMSGGNCDDYV